MSYLVVSVPEKKKKWRESQKGGLTQEKGKRKRKGRREFFSYYVISMRGGGVFSAFFPKPKPHLTHREKERDEEEEEEEEGYIKVFDF